MTEKYARLIGKIIGEPVEFSFLAKKGYFSLTDDTLTYIKGTYQSATIELKLCKEPLKTMIARFSLTEMPGCCGVLISFHSHIESKYRNKGIGTVLNQFRIEIAEFLGYTVLMCTDKESNTNQSKILKKNGWKNIHQFTNKRTNNLVNITTINV